MADLFEAQKGRLGEYQKAFRPVECQIGAVFARNKLSRQGAEGAKSGQQDIDL
jgi:hypothetical protein